MLHEHGDIHTYMVTAGVVAEVMAEVLAEVTAEISLEVQAEVAAEVKSILARPFMMSFILQLKRRSSPRRN